MTAMCDALIKAGLTTDEEVHATLARMGKAEVEEIIKERTEEYHTKLFWEFINKQHKR